MTTDDDKSLGEAATFAGQSKRRPTSEVSIGDECTLGDNRSGQDTVIDDIEIVDLEARYKIEGTLGQGGMGAVLLATDTRLDRKVAIKSILGEAACNRMAVQRFLTEAKAIAALNHPNIVQIYDYGRTKDGPFLIMEYVDGGSLLDRCMESALPLEKVIDLACQLCDGLAKAHDLGIIHRDIKPANVLLTRDGVPKLTDFGLAKSQASDHGQTVTGAVLGTPDFMPPEQRRDASLVDHRSDLWSLAATVYQMVTGRSPKIIRFKDVPESMQDVLGKALEESREARYQSMREFRCAIDQLIPRGSKLTTSTPVSHDTLTEGQCAACRTENSDLARKFCRNPTCGSSLRTPCLQCELQIPVWEAICGECGGNQPKILSKARESISSKCLSAEAHLQAYAFDAATELAREIAAATLPQMHDLIAWAPSFLARVAEERDTASRTVDRKIREAHAHQTAFDYAAALQTLETIPEALRSSAVGSLLKLCHEKHDEATRLIAVIKQRIAQRAIEGLLPLVDRAVNLRGDRQDLLNLRQQLVDRRDGRLAGARSAMSAGNACKAAKALDEVVGDDLSEADKAFLMHVRSAAALETSVVAARKEASAAKRISKTKTREILQICGECLRVHGNNAAALALASRCHTLLGAPPRPTIDNAEGSAATGYSQANDRALRIEFGVAITDRMVQVAQLPAKDWTSERSPTMLPSMPAVMAIDLDGKIHTGADGHARMLSHDASVVNGYLSLLGRMTAPLKAPACHYGDAVVKINEATEVALVVRGQRFSPDQLAAKVLTHVQNMMMEHTVDEHAKCVIAVPATFGTLARHALRRAAVAAGVQCVRLLTMTHAEALACHCRHVSSNSSSDGEDFKGIVIHWDDSCCEVSVFDASRDGVIRIISTCSDAALGAAQCKQLLVDYLVHADASTANERDITSLERRWLWSLAEAIHKDLQETSETHVVLPNRGGGIGMTQARITCVTRGEYDDMCCAVVQGIRGLIRQALQDAGLLNQSAEFDGRIYLTGSEARALAMQDIFSEAFPGKNIRSRVWHEDMASWGAALLGSVLDGRTPDLLLLTTSPWSIGIETARGSFVKLVERNTSIPTERKQVFAPVGPDLKGVAIRVFEGERPMATDNEMIGAFCFEQRTSLDTRAQLEAAIDIDADTNITVGIQNLADKTKVGHLLPYFEQLHDGFGELDFDGDEDESDSDPITSLGNTTPESHESA